MLIYEVHAETDPAHQAAFETYMRGTHLPEIFATRCFVRITFEHESADEHMSAGHFRTRYYARTRADLDRYLDEYTADFRADFVSHFPTGVKVWRQIWEEVEVFTPAS